MRLNQVTLPSLDLEKSLEFYQKLGFKLIVNSLPHYIRFQCPEGDSTLSIHLVEKLATGEKPIIYLETEDLDNKVKELISKQIQFKSLPTMQDWLWKEAHLEDPDGNQIIIFFAGENRLNPPWRVEE